MNVTDRRKNDQFKHIEDSEPFEYEGFIYMKLNNPYKIIYNNGNMKEVNAVNLENGELEYFSDSASVYIPNIELIVT